MLKNLKTALLILISLQALEAQIRLPKLINNGMVLQRNSPIIIWGWSSPSEIIKITFNDKTYQGQANAKGDWRMELPGMTAGGPYDLLISGITKIKLEDIMVGDVWLCSGQSNMVHQLDIHDVTYDKEIKNANFENIRHFKIPTATNLSEPSDEILEGVWKKAKGNDVRSFSAVAYFFAKKLHQKYNIPIGIINASVGGTPIEAWMPNEVCQTFPEIIDRKHHVQQILKNQPSQKKEDNIHHEESNKDLGLTSQTPWYSEEFHPHKWRKINIPGYWEDQGISNLNGVVWYRRKFNIPKTMTGQASKLFLGRIVDADEVYINGVKVGSTSYQYPQRRYHIDKNLLKPGDNLIAIRITNHNGKGGFVPDKPYYLLGKNDTIDLKGYWNYRVGLVFNPRPHKTNKKPIPLVNLQNQPSTLFNGMIAPISNFNIKGILWYQGESNTGHPKKYANYLKAFIKGMRNTFNQNELPFIYAQLPNYMSVSYSPSESQWAAFRQEQSKALNLPFTAMTVNIDLGEWNDIHPDNKKDVGERMATAAYKVAYLEDIVHSGPIYKSHIIQDNKILISFDHIGSGLKIKDGETLEEFAIAGEDRIFVWAKAKIVNNKVLVWHENITHPKLVRYAWANNPNNPNLINSEGLPASPFGTE